MISAVGFSRISTDLPWPLPFCCCSCCLALTGLSDFCGGGGFCPFFPLFFLSSFLEPADCKWKINPSFFVLYVLITTKLQFLFLILDFHNSNENKHSLYNSCIFEKNVLYKALKWPTTQKIWIKFGDNLSFHQDAGKITKDYIRTG